MAKGTATLTWVGSYALNKDSTEMKEQPGRIVGTSNSGTKKHFVVYKFIAPTTYNGNKVSEISKIGFYTCQRTDGIYANTETMGHGMYEGSSASLRFLVKTSSILAWSDLSKGVGKFNLGNMNDASQAPMTSSTEGKISGSNPSPTQYTPNITIEPGKTYYIFIFVPSSNTTYSQRGWVSNTKSSTNKDTTGAVEFTYTSYTPCKAPTSITIRNTTYNLDQTKNFSEDLFRPTGDTALVSWSGAVNGTANSIKTYRVYWKAGSKPTTSSYSGYKDVTVTSGKTSGSTEIGVTYSVRGGSIYFAVVAMGSAGSSYYSSMSGACMATISALPSTPTIIASLGDLKATYKSSSKNVVSKNLTEWNITSAISNTSIPQIGSFSGASAVVKYKINNGEYEQLITSSANPLKLNFEIPEGSSTKYTFASWNGLEFSSEIIIELQKNTSINLSFNGTNYGTVLKYTKNNETLNSIIQPYLSFTKEGGLGQAINYYYDLIDSAGDIKKSQVNFNNNYTLPDVRRLGIEQGSYQINVYCHDGIDYSNTVELSKNEYIVPSLSNEDFIFYNTKKDGKLSQIDSMINVDTGLKLVENDLYISIPYNETYTSWSVNLGPSSEDIESYKGNFMKEEESLSYMNIPLIDYTYGKKIDYLEIALQYNNETIKQFKFENQNLQKILNFEIFNLDCSLNPYKPFTNSSSASSSYFDLGLPEDVEILHQLYGFTDDSKLTFFFEETNGTPITKTISEKDEISDSVSYYYKITNDLIYSALNPTLPKNGEESVKLCCSLINEFGTTKTIAKTITVDYNELPTLKKFRIYTISKGEDGQDKIIYLDEINNKYYLKEGSPLYLDLKFTAYNYLSNFTLTLGKEEERNGEKMFDRIKNFTFYRSEVPEENKFEESGTLEPGSPLEYSADFCFYVLESIRESYNALFKIEIQTKAGLNYILDGLYEKTEDEKTNAVSTKVEQHLPSKATIKNSKYDDNKTSDNFDDDRILFELNITDFGLNTELRQKQVFYNLLFRTPQGAYDYNTDSIEKKDLTLINITQDSVNDWKTIQNKIANFSMGTYPSGYIQVEILTVLKDINGVIETRKLFRTNEIPVYNIMPTVAYRQNYIGINTRDFNDDGIIYISDSTGRQKIYFKSINCSAYLSLEDGSIDGFVIDGGTWI